MKTSEFIEKVNLNKNIIGLEIEDAEYFRLINGRRRTLAIVSKNNELEIDTDFSEFSYLPKKEKEDLFSLIIEYAKTPLEEREEEKVYRLRHKWLKVNREDRDAYLNFDKYDKTCFLSNDLETTSVTLLGTQAEWEQRTGRTWEQLMQEFAAEELK